MSASSGDTALQVSRDDGNQRELSAMQPVIQGGLTVIIACIICPTMSYPESKTWQHLTSLAQTGGALDIATLLSDETRMEQFSLSVAGIYADFSKQLVDNEILAGLLEIAAESQVVAKAKEMFDGERINTSEDRPVMHMAIRQPVDQLKGDFRQQAETAFSQMAGVSQSIRNGDWTGSTGKPITDIINIGIGGSDLGPKMVCAALRQFADGPRCHFISNVDGAEINTLLQGLTAETSLLIISSKTFTTSETLRNAQTALDWLSASLSLDSPQASSHCIAVTASQENAIQYGVPEDQILLFPDSIGGRYSLWSAIGLPISISTGYENFRQLLAGAAAMDQHFLTAPADQNLPLLLGMLGIWNHNFLGMDTHAVVPYCERLRLFVDHLQQMDMESNGKSVTLAGAAVSMNTGPIIWGQTGTNGQHAFFQLLHQGTRIAPVDFIGIINDELSDPAHHRLLMGNMVAQSEALMLGKSSTDLNRHYAGNRPSTTILLDQLDPASLGALVALYEHKVFTQAAVWQINPFDQWGVELGKQLANEILSGDGSHDVSTRVLMKKTGLSD